MRHACLLILALLSWPGFANAQDTVPAEGRLTVSGVVVDASNGQPVAGATVYIPVLRRLTNTDGTGGFILSNLPDGTYTFSFRRLGYASTEQEIIVRDGDFLTAALTPQPAVLAGITVVANGYEARRRRTPRGSVHALDEDYIARSGHGDAFNLVRSHGSVRVSSCGGSDAFSCIWFRGGYTRPAIYVDDQPFVGDLADLSIYGTGDLYLVEVLRGNTGVRIFVTTRMYAEQLARQGIRPKPYSAIEGSNVGGPIRSGGGLGRRRP